MFKKSLEQILSSEDATYLAHLPEQEFSQKKYLDLPIALFKFAKYEENA